MSLVALDGTPLIQIGAVTRDGVPHIAALSTIATMDAANEAVIMVGRIFTEDGGSHTIDTTGSSSLGWRTGAVTFANAGTTLKVGLSAVDLAAGPPTRAVNASDVITFDVSDSLTGGGGGVTANAWQEHVPDAGTKTIANGDLVAFCVQMTARGGADSVIAQGSLSLGTINRPGVTSYVGAAYASSGRQPNCVITFSDGTLGWFWGSFVGSSASGTRVWNSGSATKEYGNLLQAPFPMRVYGIYGQATPSADFEFVLYSDPLGGTPVAEKTLSIDANAVQNASTGGFYELFPAPYDVAADAPLGVVYKPGGSNITAPYLLFNNAAHQKAWNNGANGYAISRSTGAFATVNSNLERFPIGLLVGAFDDGGGGGGGRSILINNPSLVA